MNMSETKITSLTVAELLILMLPWDVANRSIAYDMPTATIWTVLLWLSIILIVVIIPFASGFYTGESEAG
jgi:hypothetical protein